MDANPLLGDLPFVETENTNIDILVRPDVPVLHLVLEERFCPKIDTVHACRSILGWYLAGPSCRSVIRRDKEEEGSVNLALTMVQEPPDVLEQHLDNLERYDFDDPVYSKKLGKSRDD